MSSRRLATQRAATGAALALLPVALWCLTHRYRGLTGDAELYAAQALSRSNPGLAHDVFLSDASQDRYTVFSPLYAFFINALGLQRAAIFLLVDFKLCFYGAAWAVVRKLFDARIASLSVALLIAAPLEYGAYHVFQVAEDMLTARSMAEAMAMTALCLHVYGRKTAGLALAVLTLCVHALMALPMMLLLLSLRLGTRRTLQCSCVAILMVPVVASVAAMAPTWTPGFLIVMDSSWLEMVRERSQFVFPAVWRLEDWESTARPFISLILSMLVIPDDRLRKMCASALIVGAVGLAVASIAAAIGPVAIMLQLQAWRWSWVTEVISLLLLAPTVRLLWRSGNCGSLCAMLLLMGWLVPVLDGVYFVALALGFWYGRRHIPQAFAPRLRFLAAALGTLVLARILTTGWATFCSPVTGATGESRTLLVARTLLGLDCVTVILAFFLTRWILTGRSIAKSASLVLLLGAATAFAAPAALEDPSTDSARAQIEEFADWRAVIPPGDNVLVVPRYYTAGFTWFTLQRPSYLTVDQSSGVIFSRATAIEVRRRAQVLLPLEDPDWRLLSQRASHADNLPASARPLTRDRLDAICADSELNFVVAREDVGFGSLRHRQPGPWLGYHLYDCKRVNALRASP